MQDSAEFTGLSSALELVRAAEWCASSPSYSGFTRPFETSELEWLKIINT